MPPSLPPISLETAKTEAAESNQALSNLASTDHEMVDTMLYADLDLDVKLSDAITGFKEANKKGTQAVKTEQTEAAQAHHNLPAGVSAPQSTFGVP